MVADAAWQWFRMLVIHNLHQKELGPLVKKHISALGGEFNEAIRPKYEVETLATEAARAVLNKACADFVARARRHERPQIGIRVSTGVGKTRGIIRAIADDIKANGSQLPWLYLVPTHRLGYEIEDLFAEAGVRARVFKGRQAFIGREKSGPLMCKRPEQIKMALDGGLSVEKSCCKETIRPHLQFFP